MRLSTSNQLHINAPAEAAWNALAREFNDIGAWCSVISHSRALPDAPESDDVEPGGRVCAVLGMGETHERLLYVDESAMHLSYHGTMPRAPYVKQAINIWSVTPNGPTACVVRTHASVELPFVLWLLGAPAIRLGTWWLWRRTSDDLKYYVEHGVPHPRNRQQTRRSAMH